MCHILLLEMINISVLLHMQVAVATVLNALQHLILSCTVDKRMFHRYLHCGKTWGLLTYFLLFLNNELGKIKSALDIMPNNNDCW